MAKFKIRFVCPVSSATLDKIKILNIQWCLMNTCYVVNDLTFVSEGYFQIVSWLFAKPCAETNSLYVFDHKIAHTCELALTELIHWPLLQFQNRMVRSAVPPPLASTLVCHGHQSNALTAA